ncbi:hypothetical protein MATL_G00084230 [Megalops atlanticus]|uniref:Uncharacterized protein n=1 Tax=Megalops atlanticus TaxID=7932 RepID=A0A9D3T7Z6_MEGAT|nr:hypothetical protein MATL_G00084230 [Megalops atlanticus]
MGTRTLPVNPSCPGHRCALRLAQRTDCTPYPALPCCPASDICDWCVVTETGRCARRPALRPSLSPDTHATRDQRRPSPVAGSTVPGARRDAEKGRWAREAGITRTREKRGTKEDYRSLSRCGGELTARRHFLR